MFFDFFLKPSVQQSDLGKWGEQFVADLYARKGYQIIGENFFNRRGKRLGEIDLVAVKGQSLVFVEVKTRTSSAFGTAAEAVTKWKQRRLVSACKIFINANPAFQNHNYRIDVAELNTNIDRNKNSVRIIENAVEDVW
ncbi:MAG: YraN family protein [Candidatus Doudnabacteria bacterium]|nr:YraN family protein [Candidatus Doudnabacteria bacterium]